MSRRRKGRTGGIGRRFLAPVLCCALLAGLLCGCGQTEIPSATRDIFAMDTYMTLTCYGEHAEEALARAVEEIHRLDDLLSTGKADSEVSRLNAEGGGPVSLQTQTMIEEALRVYRRTEGAFDITVYPLMELWGFTGDSPAVPDEEALRTCLEKVGADRLKLSGDMLTMGEGQAIDLGAIAKGYTSARLMQIFGEYELTSAIVSLGGNVQCFGTKPDGSLWRCGIREPEGDGYFGVVQAADKAVITSGGYERFFEEAGQTYHHILDPRTGQPARAGLISATVVSENGMLADALSTACYVMGLEDSADYWREYGAEQGGTFELILMTEDEEVWITEGLKEAFTTECPLHVITAEGVE
ncbi:MAG: FAD:protein FMN transferase [Lachnospiraceae bacterium]|nr:FAD:protein FMN transferase [Lachnospiraceae bacterium]